MIQPRYEAQYITTGIASHWRVTDKTTDSRIATCYQKENADLIVSALNAAPQAGLGISSPHKDNCQPAVAASYVKCASCGVLCYPRKNGTCPKCNGKAASAAPDSGEGMAEEVATVIAELRKVYSAGPANKAATILEYQSEQLAALRAQLAEKYAEILRLRSNVARENYT